MPIPPRRFGDHAPTEYQLRDVAGLALLWLLVYGLILLHGLHQQHQRVQTAGPISVQTPYRDLAFVRHGHRLARP